MVGSPRFGTAFGAGEAFGKVIYGLEYQFAGNMAFVFGNNLVAEVLFKIFTDYENELAKTGIDGIVNRIIHDSFAIRSQSVQLFQATITAAHTGCHHQQDRFFHGVPSSLFAVFVNNPMNMVTGRFQVVLPYPSGPVTAANGIFFLAGNRIGGQIDIFAQ